MREKFCAPWCYSDSSIWGKSPFNARVRIADIRRHAPANGIDHDAIARLMENAPALLKMLRRVISSVPLNVDSIALDYDIRDAALLIAKIEGKQSEQL